MSDWVDVEECLPENEPGMWSGPVIALADNGEIFRLACMGGCWQRTKAFVDSGATEVTHWMPLEYPND